MPKLLELPNTGDFLQNLQEVAWLLETVCLPTEYRPQITGAWVISVDGEYTQIWLTEAANWYSLEAIYHELPYYLTSSLRRMLRLMSCWNIKAYITAEQAKKDLYGD